MTLAPPGDDWLSVASAPLPVEQLARWAVLPRCGAMVMFAGTVRDHAEGRPGVVSLEYEAYTQAATAQMTRLVAEMRRRWPGLGRVGLLHRTGTLSVEEVSVAVVVSAPHRPEAFDAARYGIDAVKARVPIWKKETWAGGSAWALDAHPLPGEPGFAGAGRALSPVGRSGAGA